MAQSIVIGHGTENLHLEIDDAVRVDQIAVGEQRAADAVESNEALAQRVADALLHPSRFLPITDMVVPGDSVAIALEDGLPHPEAIIGGILAVLQGCQLGKLEVVVPPSLAPQELARLRAALPGSVLLSVHDVTDRAALGYLAADEDAHPIRVNRSLADADLVLPVSVMRLSDPLLGGPSGDALFPAMVDDAQRQRLHRFTARALQRREHYHDERAASQAHQLRWNLGVQLMVAVEVTCGGQVGRIIASSPETLRERVWAHYCDCRSGSPGEAAELREAADLVVACIEGDAAQHTPENLLRAALVARSHAAAAGTIVLLTTREHLKLHQGDTPATGEADEPGRFEREQEGLEHLDAEGEEAARLEAPTASNARSQAQFAHRMLRELVNEIDSARRYLLYFPGDIEAAEAFGFGVVPDAAALVRLINQHGSCRVLRAAQTAADARALQAASR